MLLLLLNSAYIWAFHPPTVFYMANVLLHLGLGSVLAGLAASTIKRTPLLGCFLAAALAGLYLAVAGNTHNHQAILWLHIVLGISAVVVLGSLGADAEFCIATRPGWCFRAAIGAAGGRIFLQTDLSQSR